MSLIETVHGAMLECMRSEHGDATCDRSETRPYSCLVVIENSIVVVRAYSYHQAVVLTADSGVYHTRGAVAGLVFANNWNMSQIAPGAAYVDQRNRLTLRCMYTIHSPGALDHEALRTEVCRVCAMITDRFTEWDTALGQEL